MKAILSPYTATVSELKRNPSRLLEEAGNEPVAILNHNRPTAYLVPAERYEALLERIEDLELGRIVRERQSEKKRAISVSLDEL